MQVIKVDWERWTGIRGQYGLVFTEDSLIGVRFGGFFRSRSDSSILEKLEGKSADEIMALNKRNFRVSYKDITKVEFRGSVSDDRAGNLWIKGKINRRFIIQPDQDYEKCIKIFETFLPGKVTLPGPPQWLWWFAFLLSVFFSVLQVLLVVDAVYSGWFLKPVFWLGAIVWSLMGYFGGKWYDISSSWFKERTGVGIAFVLIITVLIYAIPTQIVTSKEILYQFTMWWPLSYVILALRALQEYGIISKVIARAFSIINILSIRLVLLLTAITGK